MRIATKNYDMLKATSFKSLSFLNFVSPLTPSHKKGQRYYHFTPSFGIVELLPSMIFMIKLFLYNFSRSR